MRETMIDSEFDLITKDGRPHWLHVASGRVLPVIAGGQDDPPPAPPAPPAPTPPPAPPADRTFTQDEVNRMMAAEKHQGKQGATKEIAEALGLDPATFKPEDVKAILDRQRDADQAHMTEAEKAAATAFANAAQAEADRTAAAGLLRSAAITAALSRAGVSNVAPAEGQPTPIDVLTPSIAAQLAADANLSDPAVLDAAVAAVKATLPAAFGAPPAPTPPRPATTPPGTPPPAPPRNATTQEDSRERGRRRAAEMQGRKYEPAGT